MPTYVTLFRFTQQGIKNIKEGPARLEAAKKTCAAMGAKMQAFYLAMGRYDAIVVTEAPDDETMAKVGLTIGLRGNVRSETLRAFSEDEYRKLIAALP